MMLRAYTIHDVKGLIFHTPWFQHNDALAQRVFGDLANNPDTAIGRHPADFRLYFIGYYDDQLGQLIPEPIILHVCDAIALVVAQPTLPLEA